MRELDVLLMRYMDRVYPDADPGQREAFEALLNLPDPEILDLLTGHQIADDDRLQDVVQRLLANP